MLRHEKKNSFRATITINVFCDTENSLVAQWLERALYKGGVAGSNPAGTTKF